MIGAAYEGVTWPSSSRAGYEWLVPFDGYCRRRITGEALLNLQRAFAAPCGNGTRSEYEALAKTKGEPAMLVAACDIFSKLPLYREGSAKWESCNTQLSIAIEASQSANQPALALTNERCFSAYYGVSIGMTTTEVANATRLPMRIEEKELKIVGNSAIQWRYEKFSLYFRNGALYAIQYH